MTMFGTHCNVDRHARRAAGIVLGIGSLAIICEITVFAQRPVHPQHAGLMPPGAIGRQRLERGGPLPGYFQPVAIGAPEGALIAPAEAGQFAAPAQDQLRLALELGAVYRFKVTRIPRQEGMEVYPTVEVIDRLYPPAGKLWKFPIPIELTQRDLELAITGHFITRVIYLEDPHRALPHAQRPREQNWFEAGEGEDPLMVADRLGRPVAILRLGGRLPGPESLDDRFLFGSPTWQPAPGRVGDSTDEAGEAIPPPPVDPAPLGDDAAR